MLPLVPGIVYYSICSLKISEDLLNIKASRRIFVINSKYTQQYTVWFTILTIFDVMQLQSDEWILMKPVIYYFALTFNCTSCNQLYLQSKRSSSSWLLWHFIFIQKGSVVAKCLRTTVFGITKVKNPNQIYTSFLSSSYNYYCHLEIMAWLMVLC
jgi:hypothetical protein